MSQDIFVFGSNITGRHIDGDALKAVKYWGAKRGVGAGLEGHSYAIPIYGYRKELLSLEKIGSFVKSFIKFACFSSALGKDYVFKVPMLGCGKGQYTPEQIAPMFTAALEFEFIVIPKVFMDIVEASVLDVSTRRRKGIKSNTYAARLAKEAQREEANKDKIPLILSKHEEGLPHSDIAKLVGMSSAGVGLIVRRAAREQRVIELASLGYSLKDIAVELKTGYNNVRAIRDGLIARGVQLC